MNQLRMTNDTDGMMAIMWIDSEKSRRYNASNPDVSYAAYNEVPEIFISLSVDHGDTWSEPTIINRLTHPELGPTAIPAYVYPADKLIRVNDNTVRLYFMYTDDNLYGSFSSGDEVTTGPGSTIKFAAVDLEYAAVGNSDVVSTVKPQLRLSQNYPNPFNPSTTINYNIPTTGKVNLSVYNIKGQLVRTLVDENRQAGDHSVTWHGVDNNNNSVASGVYFYKLEANGTQEMKRMVLIK
jgi:hypothetical protein